jgi:hypothetical protein
MEAILRIAFQDHVCLAIEDTTDEQQIRLTDQDTSMGHILHRVFPHHAIEVRASVITLRPQTARLTLLDRKVKHFEAFRASLYFNSIQVFLFLRAQIYPNLGYMGSTPDPIPVENKVGPNQCKQFERT